MPMKTVIHRFALSALLAMAPYAAQATDFGQPVFEVVDIAVKK